MTIKMVEISWDEDAMVWYVAKSEILGLTSEAPTYEALMDRVLIVIPKLVALNRENYGGDNLRIRFTTEKTVEYPLQSG
jgi:hypothetical protein